VAAVTLAVAKAATAAVRADTVAAVVEVEAATLVEADTVASKVAGTPAEAADTVVSRAAAGVSSQSTPASTSYADTSLQVTLAAVEVRAVGGARAEVAEATSREVSSKRLPSLL